MIVLRFTLAALLLAPACAANAGQFSVVGTGDGLEIMQALGNAFTADHPETVVLVPPSIGSGGGIRDVGARTAILGRIARPLTDGERARGIRAVPVFKLPAAIYVHPSAGVSGLTSHQLRAIYAGTITNWSEIGGADRRIKIVRREDADSTYQVLRASMPGWQDLQITERSKTAVTTQEAIETVRDTEGAIGFGPFTRQLEATVRVLKIDDRYPTEDGYPSAVPLSFIFLEDTISQEARAFLKFATDDKAATLISNLGAVPVVTEN